MITVDTTTAVAGAREAIADAARDLELADEAVELARQRQAMGLALRGATIKAQVARARVHERLELARSALKGWEKVAADEAEAEQHEHARAEADRLRQLRERGAALDALIGRRLPAIEGELAELASAVRAHETESGAASTAPATTANRTRAWAAARDQVHSLATWYLRVNVTTIATNPTSEGSAPE